MLEGSIDLQFVGHYHEDYDAFLGMISDVVAKYKDKITFRPELGIGKTFDDEKVQKWVPILMKSSVFKSVDLYGPETFDGIERFKPLYELAGKCGLKRKAHVGEFSDAASVKGFIEEFSLEEVQHGIGAAKDDKVLQFIADKKIRCNVTPTSNVLLSAVKRMEDHPIKKMFEAGVRLSIGTDDLLFFNRSVSEQCADLVDAGAFPDPGACNEIADIEQDFVVTGEAAMTWVASNQFVALSEAAGRELKLINPPRKKADGPAGVSIQSSQMLCVSQDSKYPEEAAKFIEFFQSSVDANKILLAERGIPTFTAVREALAAELTDTEKAVYEYVDLVGSFDTGGETVNPSSPECVDAVKEQYKYYLDKVIYKEMTAEEAAQAVYDFAASQF